MLLLIQELAVAAKSIRAHFDFKIIEFERFCSKYAQKCLYGVQQLIDCFVGL